MLKTHTIHLELFSDTPATVTLFEDVKNVSELKQKLSKKEIDAVMLTPKMLISTFQISAAVNKAIHVHVTRQAKTRTVNAEIIYSLSPSTNISDAFKTFALGPGDRAVVVVILDDPDQARLLSIAKQIKGVCIPMDQLSKHTDRSMIKKKYNISEAELTVGSLEDAVICKMATHDVS